MLADDPKNAKANDYPTEAQKQAREIEIATYEKTDIQVRSLITSILSNKFAKLVLKCKGAKEMWERLAAVHEQKSQANKMVLQKRFFDLEMSKEESVQDYMSRAEYLYGQLNDIGVTGIGEDTRDQNS